MLGFADAHNHQFANWGFGGLAFWGNPHGPYDEALQHCDNRRVHGPGGSRKSDREHARMAGVLQKFFGHKVGGNPEFNGWPRWDNITHQSVHTDWRRRAADGGLRLMVMLVVNSEYIAGMATRALDRSPGDMEAVDYQLQAAWDVRAAIDNEAGGSGMGWFEAAKLLGARPGDPQDPVAPHPPGLVNRAV